MLYALIHFDLPAALSYNALGVVALMLLAWTYGTWTYERVWKRQVRSWQRVSWVPRAVLALTLVWFALRNIPVEPFVFLRT